MFQGLLLLSLALIGSTRSWVLGVRQVTIVNGCEETIWPAYSQSNNPALPKAAGGWQAEAKSSKTVIVPEGWAGTFWARQSCDFSSGGDLPCLTGSCPGGLECTADGNGITTLVELALNQSVSVEDSYDISLMFGFNLPVQFISDTGCPTVSCTANLNIACPQNLQVSSSQGEVLACNVGDADIAAFRQGCPKVLVQSNDASTLSLPQPCSQRSHYTLTFCPNASGADGSPRPSISNSSPPPQSSMSPSPTSPQTSSKPSASNSNESSSSPPATSDFVANPTAITTSTLGLQQRTTSAGSSTATAHHAHLTPGTIAGIVVGVIIAAAAAAAAVSLVVLFIFRRRSRQGMLSAKWRNEVPSGQVHPYVLSQTPADIADSDWRDGAMDDKLIPSARSTQDLSPTEEVTTGHGTGPSDPNIERLVEEQFLRFVSQRMDLPTSFAGARDSDGRPPLYQERGET